MAAILIPVNLGGVLFLDQSFAVPILILANVAMIIVGLVIPRVGGTSKLLPVPHVICRALLIGFVAVLLERGVQASDAYLIYLRILLMVNTVALVLDGQALLCWVRGEREVI